MLGSLLLIAAIIGLLPDRQAAIRNGQAALAESVAVNSSIFITTSDISRMEANLRIIVERNNDILSAAVRSSSGDTLVTIGDHSSEKTLDKSISIDSLVIVPIFEGSDEWGQVELQFESTLPKVWYGELLHPVFLLMGFMTVAGFIVFYLYLGKMLKQLDPSQAIPDRVRSALDTLAEGLLVIDDKQNIVMANLAFSVIVDEAPDDLIGRQISRFTWLQKGNLAIDEKELPWVYTLEDGLVRTADMIRLKVSDDSSRTFMANCSPILSGAGKPAGVLISFDDVTELEKKEVELLLSKEEAEQANRFKSEFLANMSHEIRTPMNAILGFAEVLKRGYSRGSNDSIRYLNTITSSGNHLLNLINDILDLSKVEAGRIEIENTEASVHQIIHEVVQILQVKADEKGIYLKFEPSGPLPEVMQTDSGKVRQIVTNLVGNAIKFTEKGGVKVVTNIEQKGAAYQLFVHVIDTGIGMTPTQCDDIFNPFTQADSSITRRFGGTGLGLTISKKFSEALGGDITVTSETGVGSQFTASINTQSIDGVKLLSIEEIQSSYFNQTAGEKQEWAFPPSKILVVDDGEENRELLRIILDDLGIQVDTAENGQVALEKLTKKTFDVVLMDVQMPVMDGYTAARLIREKEYLIPVIAMTADAMMGAEQKCLDAGYSEYMTKPVDIDRLVKRLAEILNGKPIAAKQEDAQALQNTNFEKLDSNDDLAPIFSSLPTSNQKFRSIVEKFIERLEGQLTVMDIARKHGDYDELKSLGHWLKGSSGSVGFSQFVEPARELEQYAKNKEDQNIERSLKNLQALFDRMAIEPTNQQKHKGEVSLTSKKYEIPDQVKSRLTGKNTVFKEIIEKFVLLLSDKIINVESAIRLKDYDSVVKFACWLKASGGSVGFDAFNEPARDLEYQAKKEEVELIKDTIEIIKLLSERIK